MYALALGVATLNSQQQIIEAYYPQPLLNPAPQEWSAFDGMNNGVINHSQLKVLSLPEDSSLAEVAKQLSNASKPVVLCRIAEDKAPENVLEAYLKLHLLSHRLVKPQGTNLTGIFSVLINIAWTNEGAIDLIDLSARQLQARTAGTQLSVNCVDKFPKMTDYVMPSGVRIADTSRVRLGAYLGEGTTVMHEGFVNFNAGCEGPNMIEGRISAGIWVESGSDLGGGCSTMGTLSGGGNVINSIGKDCLIGANAGVGIPLGQNCTVEAGLYITAGTKVTLLDNNRNPVDNCKARDLASKDNLLFWRNSVSGAVECSIQKNAVELNSELHKHN